MRAPRRGLAAFVVRAGRRVWRTARRFPNLMGRAAWHGFVCFYRSNDLTFASSIAYYSLLSIPPFILLVFTILSHVAVTQSGDELAVVELISLISCARGPRCGGRPSS